MASDAFTLATGGQLKIENPSDNAQDLRIFCDCDGTLFWTSSGDSFNEDLFLFLIKLKKDGHDVTIFSGEANSNEGRVKIYSQRLTGDPLFFAKDGFAVTSKTAVDGETAYLVIDDDHSTHRIKAAVSWNPNDPAVRSFVRHALGSSVPVAPAPGL